MRARALVIFAGDDGFSLGAIDGDAIAIVPVTPVCAAPGNGLTNHGDPEHPVDDASEIPSGLVSSPAIVIGELARPHQEDHTAQAEPERRPDGKSVADLIVDTLERAGIWRRRSAVTILAVPSHWCLPAAIETDNLPRRNRRQAMAYRLEEKLPLAAEEFTADFMESASGGGIALGVAVANARIAELVDRLEERGMRVDHICPETLLALEAIESPPDDSAVLLGGDDGRIDLFRFAGGRLASWRLAHAATECWALLLPKRADDEAPAGGIRTDGSVTFINVPPSVAESVACLPGLDKDTADIRDLPSTRELTLRAAQQLARRSGRPIVDFRRGSLGVRDRLARVRVPLLTAGAVVMVFLATLAGVLSYRAHLYRQAADAHHAALATLYGQAFPSQPLPVGIQRRLENHLAKLELAHGAASGSQSDGPFEPPAGLRLLQAVLGGLPTDLRLTVLELRLDGRAFTLHAQARSHGDADRIASALRQGGILRVDAPRSQALRGGDGVGFTINGDLVSSTTALASIPRLRSSPSEALDSPEEVRP